MPVIKQTLRTRYGLNPKPVQNYTIPGGTAVRICNQDVERVSLLVVNLGPDPDIWMWINEQNSPFGIHSYSEQKHIIINQSSFPYLVASDWWVYSALGADIKVFEVSSELPIV